MIVERVVIVTLRHDDQYVKLGQDFLLHEYQERFKHMREEGFIINAGVIDAMHPQIAAQWQDLELKHSHGKAKWNEASPEIADRIARTVFATPSSSHLAQIKSIPQPKISDRYHILLVGHGAPGNLDISISSAATLILAAVRLLSMGYPSQMLTSIQTFPLAHQSKSSHIGILPHVPIRVSLMMCHSGSASPFATLQKTSSLPPPLPGSRPIAPHSSVAAQIGEALSNTQNSYASLSPLTFRIKGYGTRVHIAYKSIRRIHTFGSSRSETEEITWMRYASHHNSEKYSPSLREELVTKRVFAHAALGGGHVNTTLTNDMSDSDDE